MKRIITLIFVTFLSHSLISQNFSNGFNFNLPHNDNTPSVYLPNFPAKNITDAERVSVQGENFMVAGKPYRFWGVNLTTLGCFPLKENAPKMAARMRKMGINLVRFHHMDNPWSGSDGSIFSGQTTRSLNTATLDRLDFLISELKKNSIYANINLNVSRTFTTADGIAGADSLKDFGKGLTVFDPQIIALEKEYARQLLTHVNPYTNKTLAAEPTVAVVEMINENSLYGMWKDDALKHTKVGGSLLQRHINFLDSSWNAFLLKKYSTQTALQTAWTNSSAGISTERIQNGGFENTALGTNWQNEIHNGALATFLPDATQKISGSQSAKIQITNTTGTDWHIQFKYVNLSFKKDSNYILKFSAKASKNRIISASLMRNDAPYTWYGGQNFNLTTDWQIFQISFIPTEDINGAGRLSFSLGQTDGSIWLDDVSFAEPVIQTFETGETLASQNIRRLLYSEKASFTKQRVADMAEFYLHLQKSFMEDMRLFLKNELGVKALITGTNALTGIQEGLEHEQMDYYDDHNYWDHPWFPGVAWDMNNWLIQNKSPLKDPNFSAITQALNGIAMADKPFTISEYNQPFPNRFRTEMMHEWAAYGSFHGMDGLMFFEYSGDAESTASKDFIPGFFNTARDPSVMALFPSCAFAYRNGLIASAKQPVLVSYSRKDIYNSFAKDNQGRWGKYVPYDLKTQLTHSIRTKTYNSNTDYTPSVLPIPATNIFETDTKETVLNTTKGILTTNTPHFIAITGFLKDATSTQVGNLTLQNATDFGSLTWLSLNSKILSESDTSLLTLSSKAQNTGMIWNADNTSLSNNLGAAPTQMLPLEVTLRLNINAESIDIHTLTPTGQSQSFKNIKPTIQGVFDIKLSQSSDKTLWYGIVTQQATSLKDSKNELNIEVTPNPVRDILTVKYTIQTIGNTDINLTDMTGKTVFYKKMGSISLGEKTDYIDVSAFASGVYMLKIGNTVKKVVVER